MASCTKDADSSEVGSVFSVDSEDAVANATIEGSQCTIQTLYEGASKCHCCINWVDDYPDDLFVKVEQQKQSKQKALIVRMRKSHQDGKSLVLDSVLIQSQSLKETLARVFEGYQGITPNLKKLVFRAPFRPFYYRWETFTRVLEDQKANDPEAASYSQLLYDVLDAEMRDTRDEVADLLENGVITHELLWSLFEPGERMIAKFGSHPRFFVAQQSRVAPVDIFEVKGKYVDWDGTKFGYVTTTLQIRSFAGTQQITELDVFPARFQPSLEDVESEVIARGKRFRDLKGFHHMAYSGNVTYKDSWENMTSCNTEGRVIVDSEAYYEAFRGERPRLESLDSAAITPQIRIRDREHGQRDWEDGIYDTNMRHMGPIPPPPPPIMYPRPEGCVAERERKETSDQHLTDDQLLLCTTKVRGYSLSLKSWVTLDIANIKDIAWNDAAFPNLMLPAKYKSLVLAFVEGQISQRLSHQPAFDDIIEGKGQGVVMLLVGNPGTGKTLTAEAVADRVRRPLYVLSVGELGHGDDDMEMKLKATLKRTEKWNAVLLFDECDVLLQERSSSRLEHNELVTVFLRMLEYYRGIIIMTTNRVETMDKAFQSRIHLTLRYPDLDPAAKEHLWRYFVAQTQADSAITNEVYGRLAQLPLNGRQIKNTVKISMLLAAQEKEKLDIEYIDTVLQATMEMGTEKT